MTLEALTIELESCSTAEDALRIQRSVEALPSGIAFELLFTLATKDVGIPNVLAAALLVDVEPPCPVGCEAALRILAAGQWQVSDHNVPFYLITQFGKSRLIEAATTLANELEGEARQSVATVAYHAHWPAASMRHWPLWKIVAGIERDAHDF